MIRKNWFYFSLIIIFLLYLVKDNIIGFTSNLNKIENYICEIKNTEIVNDYNELLKITNLEKENYDVTYSRVIRRDISEFYNTIVIDKGYEDIKVGDAVVTEYGLIGIIKKCYKNYSEVSLLTNKNTNISVKINDAYGILYSKNNKLLVKNIKIEGSIKEGDIVLTSGLTSIPEGIKIGEVKDINKDNLELEYILNISNTPMQHIKYVGVISL